MAASKADQSPLSVRSYMPQDPNGPFPYSLKDLTPMEPSNDMSFYSMPRYMGPDVNLVSLLKFLSAL